MARNRVPRQYVRFVELVRALVKSLFEGGKADPVQRGYHQDLARSLEAIEKLNDRQEQLKVELVQTTSALEKELDAAREMVARVVSYLEAKYGKASELVRSYGIAPRKRGSRRSQTAPPKAPAA